MHDEAARARVARGWMTSSLDQPTYAAMNGISARTLRDWVCRYGGGRRPQAQLRAAVVASIEQLQNVLAALDAEAAAGSATLPIVGKEVDDEVERHAASARPAATACGEHAMRTAEPLAFSATTLEPPAPAAVHDNEATRDERERARPELAPADLVAVVGGAGEGSAPCRPAARAVGQHARGAFRGDAPAGVLDFEALRNRAAELRAASGAPRGKSFFDWEAQ